MTQNQYRTTEKLLNEFLKAQLVKEEKHIRDVWKFLEIEEVKA